MPQSLNLANFGKSASEETASVPYSLPWSIYFLFFGAILVIAGEKKNLSLCRKALYGDLLNYCFHLKTSEEAFNPVSVANHSGEAKSLEVSKAEMCAVDSALHAVCPDGLTLFLVYHNLRGCAKLTCATHSSSLSSGTLQLRDTLVQQLSPLIRHRNAVNYWIIIKSSQTLTLCAHLSVDCN